MILYINARCNQWAEWCARREKLGVGFPKECAYTRLQGRGGLGVNQAAFDEGAWQIQKAVNSLNDVLKEATAAFYLGTRTIEQRAKMVQCSVPTLYRRIDLSHVQIMEWLNDDAAGLHPPYSETPCIREKVSV